MKRLFMASVVIVGLAGSAFAADVKFDVQSCYSGPLHFIQHADGMIGGSYEGTAMDPGTEGSPIYMMSRRCVGAFTMISGDYNENGSCEFWNAQGNKFFGVYARKGDPVKAEGTWHVVHGTGKFAGMTGDTKWMPVTNFPPVPNIITTCNHEWGTYSNLPRTSANPSISCCANNCRARRVKNRPRNGVEGEYADCYPMGR